MHFHKSVKSQGILSTGGEKSGENTQNTGKLEADTPYLIFLVIFQWTVYYLLKSDKRFSLKKKTLKNTGKWGKNTWKVREMWGNLVSSEKWEPRLYSNALCWFSNQVSLWTISWFTLSAHFTRFLVLDILRSYSILAIYYLMSLFLTRPTAWTWRGTCDLHEFQMNTLQKNPSLRQIKDGFLWFIHCLIWSLCNPWGQKVSTFLVSFFFISLS